MDSKQLKLILQIRGIKQRWISEKLGVSMATVSYWVTGKKCIPLKHQLTLTSLLYEKM